MKRLGRLSSLLIVIGLLGSAAAAIAVPATGYRDDVVDFVVHYGMIPWAILVIGLVLAGVHEIGRLRKRKG